MATVSNVFEMFCAATITDLEKKGLTRGNYDWDVFKRGRGITYTIRIVDQSNGKPLVYFMITRKGMVITVSDEMSKKQKEFDFTYDKDNYHDVAHSFSDFVVSFAEELIKGAKNNDENAKSDKIVEITKVKPNPNQPRKVFNEDELQELAASIKEFGMLEPVLVVNTGDSYEILAGEKRWQAAKIAGLKEIPVTIHEYNEKEIQEITLIDNIMRLDLNPIEEAMAYKELIDEFRYTRIELAEKMAKSRTVALGIRNT